MKLTCIAVVMLVSVPLVLSAGEDKEIVIKNSAVKRDVVLLDGRVQNRDVQLECFSSVPHCTILKQGNYLLVYAPRGEGPYMDCVNVYLYDKNAASQRSHRVGTYCLLDE